MDLNPYKFEAPFEAFEFANFHKERGTSLLLVSTAWLLGAEYTQLHQVNYWATRLKPLLHSGLVAAICNRTGTEGTYTFCGTSCVLEFDKEAGVSAVANLDHQQEALFFTGPLDLVERDRASSSASS